jgi:hypothetical protein
MSGVFQNIDPPPPHHPASVYPPAFGAGGGHTCRVERRVGGQYFGRRQTLLCTLHNVSTFWATERWPLQIAEIELNGDSKSTNEGRPSLVGSNGDLFSVYWRPFPFPSLLS